MNGSFDVTTIVFAILAVFVVWKLRSVLGTRTGNERPPFDPFARRNPVDRGAPAPEGKVIPLPGSADRAAEAARVAAPDRWRGYAEAGSPVARGLDDIARADPAFDIAPFMQGARAAYEAIITAFAKGDRQALKPLLARDVYEGFAAEIDRREQRGEVVDTTFVSTDKAVIEDAQLRGRIEQVAIRFTAKLITVTRDKSGAVIDGNPETVADIVDLWTFSRSADSRDPNWQLIATEAGQ